MTDHDIIEAFAKRDSAWDERVNTIETKVDELNGYLRGVVESNTRLISLFTKALYVISFISIVAVGAVIYGAIGENGMKSVREVIPDLTYAIPTDNHDLDGWQNGDKNEPAS